MRIALRAAAQAVEEMGMTLGLVGSRGAGAAMDEETASRLVLHTSDYDLVVLRATSTHMLVCGIYAAFAVGAGSACSIEVVVCKVSGKMR